MKTKHILALLLSLLMVLTMSMTAFAADETGTLTVNGAAQGNTYTLYKVFDLESYTPDVDESVASYSYTITTSNPFYNCVRTMKTKVEDQAQPMNVFDLKPKAETTDVFYVSLNPSIGTVNSNEQTIKEIAANLLACINNYKENNPDPYAQRIDKIGVTGQEQKLPTGADIEVTPTTEDPSKYNVAFKGLDLGYYLLDTSVSTVVGLTTTKPDATIQAKDVLPAVDKRAERHVDGTWGDDGNSKSIGEISTFRTAVTVEEGAKNYILYDKMEPGLKFKGITKIYYGSDQLDRRTDIYSETKTYDDMETTVHDTEDGMFITDNTTGKTILTIQTANAVYNEDPMDFKITFEDEFLKTVYEEGTTTDRMDRIIFIEYETVVTEEAIIGSQGNINKTWLTYGDNNVALEDSVRTYVFEFDVVKTDGSNVLEGAKFELYVDDGKRGRILVPLVKDPNASNPTIYRVANETERDAIEDGKMSSAFIEAGYVRISGVGAAFGSPGRHYYLKETEAPAGYNMLSAPKDVFIMGNEDFSATVTDGKYIEGSGGIEVENKQGSLLPSTGGIGTTIFYVLGGVLILGAMVLLITKRRMKAEK